MGLSRCVGAVIFRGSSWSAGLFPSPKLQTHSPIYARRQSLKANDAQLPQERTSQRRSDILIFARGGLLQKGDLGP